MLSINSLLKMFLNFWETSMILILLDKRCKQVNLEAFINTDELTCICTSMYLFHSFSLVINLTRVCFLGRHNDD